jgi:hypothetical protein
MSLFGQIVRTAINVATLPVAVAKDVVTLGRAGEPWKKTYTEEKLEQIKEERGSYFDPGIRVVEQAQFYPASVTPHGWLSAAGAWVPETHVHRWRPLPVPPGEIGADQKGEEQCL